MTDPAAPRRRRWPWLVAALGVVGGAGAVWWALSGGNGEVDAGATAPLELRDVVVTDLEETETYAGTLGRPDGDPILTRRPGTVTATAAEGSTVAQGEVLFTVDDEPTVLLYGEAPAYRMLGPDADGETVLAVRVGTITSTADADTIVTSGQVLFELDDEPVALLDGGIPAYRTLRDGSEGTDVLQLEEALVALGYDPDETVTIDEDFTAATENMVERWQEEMGMEEDGVVDLGEVVFLPGPVTVEQVAADEGDLVSPGTPVMAVSFVIGELEGVDVAQVEAALDALGYTTGPVDDRLDAVTATAILAFQEDMGMKTDGRFELGEVVFRPGPIRVTDVLTLPGSPAGDGTPVLATSSADTFVTVDLPAADQGVLEPGDTVVVELPSGATTPGTVDEVGSVATTDQAGDSTFEVRIVLDHPGDAAGLDEAPVDVEVVTDSRSGVTAVPVTALVALAEGGYAVEVATGSTTRLVAVEPGFYAEGLVEIVSGDVSPGDRVIVP